MGKFLILLERYKYAIVITLGVYVAMFIFLQMNNYELPYYVTVFGEDTKVDIIDEKELELSAENLQIADNMQAGEVKNMSRDVNDSRQRSDKEYFEYKTAQQIEADIQNDIKQTQASTGGEAKRQAILKEMETRKADQKTKTSSSKDNKTTNAQSGGNTAFKGNVMIDWSLSSRNPYQNNNWWVRNPGYTCGHNSSGKVLVRIKVNKAGNVISATYDPSKTSNANGCMIENAEKYAKMSRFDYSSSAPETQDGYILYTFVSQ